MNETAISAAPGAPGADSPFHEGELAAQRRAGFLDAADLAGRRSIRDYLPDQHRQFYEHLPFMVIGAVDRSGQPWVTMRVGQPGFISSPDPRTLRIAGDTLRGDPLNGAWHRGALFGGLGIELPTRRRNRATSGCRSNRTRLPLLPRMPAQSARPSRRRPANFTKARSTTRRSAIVGH